MFAPRRTRRVSLSAPGLALACLALAILTGVQAMAHHPGTHAAAQGDGRVRIDAVATASDTCTTIAAVEPGAPKGVQRTKDSEPVTVRLARKADAVCGQAVQAVRMQAVLALPPAKVLLVYVVGADGQVVATERVPVAP